MLEITATKLVLILLLFVAIPVALMRYMVYRTIEVRRKP